MPTVLRNQWFRLGAASTLAALLGAAIAVAIVLGALSGPSAGDHVSLTSGGNVGASIRANIPAIGVPSLELPLTAAEAVAAGWEDPILCSVGRGRYFQKAPDAADDPFFLMFNSEDELIGIYLVSKNEMPSPPWRRVDELKGAGSKTIIDAAHWSLIVYFRDPARACKITAKRVTGRGYQDSAVKSTPTPYVAPTPTPSPAALLLAVAERMAALEGISFTLTSDPPGTPLVAGIDAQRIEGTVVLPDQVTLQVTGAAGAPLDVPADSLPFQFGGLAAVLGQIARDLEDPSGSPSAWIDNVQTLGVSGAVQGQKLRALFPSATSDADMTVRLWVDATHMVRRVRIEGALAPGDPPGSVRVLDLGELQ